MSGKQKCKILKLIREKIARKNNIKYEAEECSYQGECKGTCPKCEEEVRYLERELEKRKEAGEVVEVEGVADVPADGAEHYQAVAEEWYAMHGETEMTGDLQPMGYLQEKDYFDDKSWS